MKRTLALLLVIVMMLCIVPVTSTVSASSLNYNAHTPAGTTHVIKYTKASNLKKDGVIEWGKEYQRLNVDTSDNSFLHLMYVNSENFISAEEMLSTMEYYASWSDGQINVAVRARPNDLKQVIHMGNTDNPDDFCFNTAFTVTSDHVQAREKWKLSNLYYAVSLTTDTNKYQVAYYSYSMGNSGSYVPVGGKDFCINYNSGYVILEWSIPFSEICANGKADVGDSVYLSIAATSGPDDKADYSYGNFYGISMGDFGYMVEQKQAVNHAAFKLSEDTVDGSPRVGKDASEIFTDVKENSWFRNAVNYVVAHELMNGTSKTLFEPNSNMTRAMLVTVLWRYEGSPTGFKNNFDDVPAGKWYTDAVAWAGENEIVTGVAEGKFDPGGNITREQLATIFHRYTTYIGSYDGVLGSLSKFTDKDKVSKWADTGMKWAYQNQIISGITDKNTGKTYLDPRGNATRAQVATVLMRYCSNMKFIHSWSAGQKISDPTCTAKGQIRYYCNDCGAVKTTAISALGHKKTNEKVTKEPTCTEKGSKTYYCTRCSKTVTESIAPKGHKWSDATCTAPKTCSRCGITSGSALGHKYGNPTVKAATCTESGKKTYICTRCGHHHYETIKALGHKYGDPTVKDATCTKEGTKTYICTRCGHHHYEKIPAKGHKWKDATCTAPKTCTRCKLTSGSALGHKYDKGEVTKGATNTYTGVKTYTCSRCGHKHNETIPKLKVLDSYYNYASSDFRRVKRQYYHATGLVAYCSLYIDRDGDTILITNVKYEIINTFSEVTYHNLTSGGMIIDPLTVLKNEESKYFGANKLAIMEWESEIMTHMAGALNGTEGFVVSGEWLNYGT